MALCPDSVEKIQNLKITVFQQDRMACEKQMERCVRLDEEAQQR